MLAIGLNYPQVAKLVDMVERGDLTFITAYRAADRERAKAELAGNEWRTIRDTVVQQVSDTAVSIKKKTGVSCNGCTWRSRKRLAEFQLYDLDLMPQAVSCSACLTDQARKVADQHPLIQAAAKTQTDANAAYRAALLTLNGVLK